MKYLMVVLLTAGFFGTIEAKIQPNKTSALTSTFIHSGKGYSIRFPSHWQWESPYMDMDVIAVSTDKGSPANISAMTYPEKISSFDRYLDRQIQSLKAKHPSFKLIETGTLYLDKVEGRKIAYTLEPHMRLLQVFLYKDKTIYMITCACTENEYYHYKEPFEDTLRSFRLPNRGS